jgi:hypothetical protein
LSVDDYEEELDKPPSIPKELHLFDEELALSSSVFWFKQVLESADLLKCLGGMPTGQGRGHTDDVTTHSGTPHESTELNTIMLQKKNSNSNPVINSNMMDLIARQELVQFASIVMEIEPAWRALVGELSKVRMEVEDRAKKQRQKEKEFEAYELTMRQSEEVVEREQEAVSVALAEVQSKEEVALTSHVHTYVTPLPTRGVRGGRIRAEPFCTACKLGLKKAKIESFKVNEEKALQHYDRSSERLWLGTELESVRVSSIFSSLTLTLNLTLTLTFKDASSY